MKPRNLLTRGNGKLGEGIHAWTLPAVETCPGRSALCERACYARAGRYRTQFMRDHLTENLDAAMENDFASRVVAEIRCRGVHTLRVHVSGDFFNPGYAKKWLVIARRAAATRLYAYTRSWRVPEVAPVLAELAGLRNVRLWYSCDAQTGPPDNVPPRVRVAFLQTDAEEEPAGNLVFRVERLRAEPARRVGLTLICPRETGLPGAADVTCTSCRRCHG